MALPRPTLLAIAGAMLSLISFTMTRAIGTQSAPDIPVPGFAGQSAVGGGQEASKGASQNDAKPAPPPEPRVEDVPPAVSDALADGKVVVLLFTEKNAADDAATARHFSTLSQLGSGVATFHTDIGDVGRYAGIVAHLGITQAPSIVIVRPDLRAVPPIEGYVESQYLLQRVKDQL
jgi:hypothetical protein